MSTSRLPWNNVPANFLARFGAKIEIRSCRTQVPYGKMRTRPRRLFQDYLQGWRRQGDTGRQGDKERGRQGIGATRRLPPRTNVRNFGFLRRILAVFAILRQVPQVRILTDSATGGGGFCLRPVPARRPTRCVRDARLRPRTNVRNSGLLRRILGIFAILRRPANRHWCRLAFISVPFPFVRRPCAGVAGFMRIPTCVVACRFTHFVLSKAPAQSQFGTY